MGWISHKKKSLISTFFILVGKCGRANVVADFFWQKELTQSGLATLHSVKDPLLIPLLHKEWSGPNPIHPLPWSWVWSWVSRSEPVPAGQGFPNFQIHENKCVIKVCVICSLQCLWTKQNTHNSVCISLRFQEQQRTWQALQDHYGVSSKGLSRQVKLLEGTEDKSFSRQRVDWFAF